MPPPQEIVGPRYLLEPPPLVPAPPPSMSEEPPRPDGNVREECRCGCGFGWHDRFMEGLRICPNLGTGCEQAGVHRNMALEHRQHFPAFAQEWDATAQNTIDKLERELWARAPNSPMLARMFMQGYRRSIFGERQELLEATLLAALDYSKLSQMQLAMLAAGESVVKVLVAGSGEAQAAAEDPDKPFTIEPGWPARQGEAMEPRESDLVVSAQGRDEPQ